MATSEISSFGTALVGVTAPGPSPDEVLVTVAGDGVSRLSCTTHAPLRSWPLGATHISFACAAIYCPRSARYCAVLEESGSAKRRVAFWREAYQGSLAALETTVPLKLPPAVAAFSLVPIGDDGDRHDCGLLLGDGSLLLLCEGDGAATRVHSAAPGGRALSARLHDGLLSVLTTRPAADGAVLTQIALDSSVVLSEATVVSELAPPSPGGKLLAACALKGCVLSAWADGRVCVDRIAGGGRQHTLEMAHLRDSRAAATPRKRSARDANGAVGGGGDARAVLVPLSATAAALLSPAPANGTAGLVCVVLEVALGACVVQSSRRVELTGPPVAAGDRLDAVLLPGGATEGGCLVAAAAGGRLLTLDLALPPYELASMLGCFAPGSRHAAAAAAADTLTAASLAAATAPAQLCALPAAATPSPPPRDVAADLGRNACAAFVTVGGAVAVAEAPEAAGAAAAALARGGADDVDELADALLRCAAGGAPMLGGHAERAARELADQGAWRRLGALCAARPLESLAACPGVLAGAARAGEHEVLARLLADASDVHPDDLAACLAALLQPEGAAASLAARAREEAAACCSAAEGAAGAERRAARAAAAAAAAAVDDFSAPQLALHPVIAARLDGLLLAHACQRLSTLQASRLALYLARWLRKLTAPMWHSVSDGYRLQQTVVPSLRQVAAWSAALLDAKYGSLVVARGPQRALADLAVALGAYVDDTRALGGLLGLLGQLRRGKALPDGRRTRSRGWTVELLDLSVH